MFAPRRVSVLLLLLLSASLLFPHTPLAQQSNSIPALISRADSGDASARQQIFQFLLHADPASPDFDSEIAWLRSLASRDSADAEFTLGYLYAQGRGLPLDYSKAAENYQAAALHDHHSAQNNLAFLYQHGLGVPKDLHVAFELYLAASQQNDASAQCNLATMYYVGAGGIPRDLTQAARWFRSAANLGDPVAQHDLAVFYSEGLGVEVNFKEAARWEDLSALQGYTLAESGLAALYESGKGVPLNYPAAYAWYSRAQASGDKSAAVHLKSLATVMTPKQLDRAHAYLAALPTPPSNSVEQAQQSAPISQP